MIQKTEKSELMLFGIPASPGIAHGCVFRFLHDEVQVATYEVSESDQEEEIKRFLEALEMTKSEIREIREDVAKNLGEKEAGIFDAHMLVLEDRALIEDVKKEIKESGQNVEKCVHRVTEKYLAFFDQLEDYLRNGQSIYGTFPVGCNVSSGTTASGTAFLDEPKVWFQKIYSLGYRHWIVRKFSGLRPIWGPNKSCSNYGVQAGYLQW